MTAYSAKQAVEKALQEAASGGGIVGIGILVIGILVVWIGMETCYGFGRAGDQLHVTPAEPHVFPFNPGLRLPGEISAPLNQLALTVDKAILTAVLQFDHVGDAVVGITSAQIACTVEEQAPPLAQLTAGSALFCLVVVVCLVATTPAAASTEQLATKAGVDI